MFDVSYLSLGRKSEDELRDEARSLQNQIDSAKAAGDLAKAAQLLERKVAVSRRLGARGLLAAGLYDLGILLMKLRGKLRKVETVLRDAARIWREDGVRERAADAHLALAGVYLLNRRIGDARRQAISAQALYQASDAPQVRRRANRLLGTLNAVQPA